MSAAAVRFSNVAVGVCALVLAGLAVRREIKPATPEPPRPDTARYIVDWQSLRSDNTRIGPPGAAVELIEFIDFECPYCAQFASRLTTLMQKYPQDISLTLKHLPISGHRFARSAATAFECARGVGRMEQMYSALLAGQDSLGLKSLNVFAAESGVQDIGMFEECLRVEPEQVATDAAVAAKLGVSATPSIIVNGWLLSRPPTNMQLEEIVRMARGRRAWSPAHGDTINVDLGGIH